MNSLRIRLAVGFSILFTVFFAVALLIIYFSYADYRSEIFHRRLKDRAITTFRLLIHVEKIDSQLLKEIDRNTLNSLYDEKVIVLEENQVLYSSIDNIDIKYDKNFLYDHRWSRFIGVLLREFFNGELNIVFVKLLLRNNLANYFVTVKEINNQSSSRLQ